VPRRELRQRALAAAVFGLLSLFALSAAGQVNHALYLVAFAFVVAVIAIVAGASASRRARREETARPRGSLAAVILGSVAIFLCAVALVAIVFARQFADYQTCISNAPTSAAKQACATKFMQAVQKQVNGQGG
jgi:predicted PurR-regulated permease PerM